MATQRQGQCCANRPLHFCGSGCGASTQTSRTATCLPRATSSSSISAHPDRTFIGRAELASAAHDWTPSEAQVYPGDSAGGVLLAEVEEWNPPVAMSAVLSKLDPAGGARADFETGILRITANEYETALEAAAGRATSTG
jgi:hypothetical protein